MSYHVRRTEREITDPTILQSMVERGKYGIIGLAMNNEPYVVTLSYGYDKKGNALFFHCSKEGQKIDFIRANPLACVTIIEDDGFDADSCDHSYRSVILRGKIQLIDNKNEVDHAIRLMVSQLETRDTKRFLDKLTAGNKSYDNLQILKLVIESITGKERQKK